MAGRTEVEDGCRAGRRRPGPVRIAAQALGDALVVRQEPTIAQHPLRKRDAVRRSN